MVEKAFEKEDLAALMRVVASMRNKIQTHDACAGGQAAAVSGPLVPAPAPSASPAARPASQLSHRLPFAPEPRLEPREAWGVNAVKRRRKPAFSSGADAPDKVAFFHRFRTFAFEFGREKLKNHERLHRVSNLSVFEAFKTSAAAAQGDPQSLHHYFDREQWFSAVEADDIDLFRVKRTQTAVQKAATLPEKLQAKPGIKPLVDWCLTWIQAKHAAGEGCQMTCSNMTKAYDAAIAQTPRLFGDYSLRSLLTNCNICWAMLVAAAREQQQ